MSALLEAFDGSGDALAQAESWRYSRHAVRALEQQTFAAADASAQLTPDLCARYDWPQTRGRRLVFVNGTLSAAHSDVSALASGVVIGQLPGHGCAIALRGDAMLHLVFASVAGAAPAQWRSALDIRAEDGCTQVIEQHVGVDAGAALGMLTATVAVAAAAHLRMTTLGDLPEAAALFRRTTVALAAGAALDATHALCGGHFLRAQLDVALDAPGARFALRGVSALHGRQHADVQIDVRHAAPDTTSDVLWRGVADDRARGILRGAIIVAPGADGADARLQTKNLLLSPHAEIDAQPALEIYADEVKASHGATVGELDARALFYLRTRGVPLATARNLLIAGFCREAFADVADAELRERLDALIAAHLPVTDETPA
ncbi:MAG: SufB/SufD family protein [Rudaea sp.]